MELSDEDFNDDVELSVLEYAFKRSGLKRTTSCDDSPLGTGSWDLWVLHVLNLSGISVELVDHPQGSDVDVPLHTSVQVVSEATVKDAMNRDLNDISFARTRTALVCK